MKTTNTYIILSLLLIILDTTVSTAQDSLTKKRKEIHLGFGPDSYSGDLGKAYSKASLLLTLGLKFNIDRRLNGNVKISIGTVTGQELDYTSNHNDGQSASPNTFFKSSFFALNYELHHNIIDKVKYKIYLSQGIGFLRFDPKDQFNNSLKDQPETRPLGESYGNLTIFLPTQIGFKYYFINEMAVGVQVGLLNTMMDNLGNLSTWGNKNGNDNISSIQFQIHVPLY